MNGWLIRIAATLILISQLLLLNVIRDPNGSTAIWFAFGGHTILGLGIALAAAGIVQRVRSQTPDDNG